MDAGNHIKKYLSIVLFSLVISVLVLSCSYSPKALTEKDNGKRLVLKRNEIIMVNLESNPSTGYSWDLVDENMDDVVLLIASDYHASSKDKNLVGGGGYQIFTFQARSSGSADIILSYRRPWEEETKPLETFRLDITVRQ
jgi:inhibitor of cysteine peptidase